MKFQPVDSDSERHNLCVCFVAVILCRQSFDQQPTLTEVNPGSAAILICRVYEKRGRCSWQKDGKVIPPFLTYVNDSSKF